jgi:uncharacterized protein
VSFLARYGPWAVVAGASEGLGAAFASALAERGVHLVLLARRGDRLTALARELGEAHGVEIRTVACDLGDGAFTRALGDAISGVEVGLGVYNAAYSFVGPLLEHPLEESLRVIDVNCRGPVRLVHALAPAMVARKHGGIVVMSSLAGFHGGPRLAAYSASKAFNTVLGEGLAAELRAHGVDLVVSCPGAIRTPNFRAAARGDAPGTLDAPVVVACTLHSLGRRTLVVPGTVNRLASFCLRRLLPRTTATRVMGRSVQGLS